MAGILLLFAMAIWLAVAIWLSKIVTKKLPKLWWRIPVGLLIFVTLLPLPLIDEIVAGRQFSRLCIANVVHVNANSVRGKTIYLEAGAHEEPVPGTWVKIWRMPFRYLDATTGEVVMSFDHLRAEGGRLFPGFDSGHDPLTFKGTCKPPGVSDKRFYAELGLTLIERPQSK